jgi:hypothetical protein
LLISKLLLSFNVRSVSLTVYYGDVDHPVPGQIDHWVS